MDQLVEDFLEYLNDVHELFQMEIVLLDLYQM